jgi:hypothetical protein
VGLAKEDISGIKDMKELAKKEVKGIIQREREKKRPRRSAKAGNITNRHNTWKREGKGYGKGQEENK